MDMVIILILAWSAWQGFRSGLLKGAARFTGLIAGLVSAFAYYEDLAKYAEEKWHFGSLIYDRLIWPNFPLNPVKIMEKLPALQDFNNFTLYGDWIPRLSLEGKFQEIGNAFSRLLASGILEICSFVLIFLLVSQGIYIIGTAASKILSFTLIGLLNNIGGAAFGLVRGIFVVLILTALAVSLQWPLAMTSGGKDSSWLADGLAHSRMAPYFLKVINIYKNDLPGFSPGNIV